MDAAETSTPEATYRASRKAGHGAADSCRAVRAAHPEVTFDAVVDLSWKCETGKASPDFKSGGRAVSSWERGHSRRGY